MSDDAGFRAAVRLAGEVAAREDRIVTLGVTPTSPHTGYGYIEQGDALVEGAFTVAAFVEKREPNWKCS